MKGKVSEHTVGMVVGALAGLWHFVWAMLVAGGFAQGLLDWIYTIHFLNNPFRVAQFDVTTAVMLVIATSLIGYVVGWVLASLWNMMAKRR